MTKLHSSKRIRALQRELASAIPLFPNNKASRQVLNAMHLTDLINTYIGWRLRYVARPPRTVTGRDRLAGDPRAAALQPNIDAFVRAVETGQDLTPYLSIEPHTKGYTPAAGAGRGGDTWADKDFLLNVMGLHHFHLGIRREARGHMERTNEVIFASVTRDTLDLVGLFDHGAFAYDPTAAMTPERARLWSAFTQRQEAGALPGQIVLGGYGGTGIAQCGRPLAVVIAGLRQVDRLKQVDPRLDDPSFVRGLYGPTPVPVKPKLRWQYRHLDFGLLDEDAGFFGVLEYGPN